MEAENVLLQQGIKVCVLHSYLSKALRHMAYLNRAHVLLEPDTSVHIPEELLE
jgi:hypothetical protein